MASSIFVLDSSFLIWAKKELPDSIGETLDKVTERVKRGIVAFPRQVRQELDRYDDELSAWAKRCWRDVRRYDVDVVVAAEVTNRVAAVVDTTKTVECADPWIIAQAVEYQRKEPGKVVSVVSNDYRDKAIKKSVRWACGKEGVAFVRPAEFLLQIDQLVSDARRGTLFEEDL